MSSKPPVTSAPTPVTAALDVTFTDDFELTGRGDFPAWDRVAAVPMSPVDVSTRDEREYHRTWFKCLWSHKGIYFLIDCEDRKLAAAELADGGFLWTQDVVEIFLWPDPDLPLYLEAQVSPLGKELVLMVPNVGGHFLGWAPWQYEGPRRMRSAVSVRGGPASPMATIEGWRVELFIPSTLFRPLANTELKPGVTWRGNVYRIDHDAHPGELHLWAWDRRVGRNFHDFQKYGVIRFV